MKRLLLLACLSLSSCAEAHSEPLCDPSAHAGDTCSGAWSCPATSIEGSTGTHYTETRCVDGIVHERTWSDPAGPTDPILSCDPAALPGASCEGEWVCAEDTSEGSTGTHHVQVRCVDGRVVRDFWIEPPPELDAGVPIEMDCRVVLEEPVSASTEWCGRPGIAVEGERVRIAWPDSGYQGVLATREGGAWNIDRASFGTNARRIDLAAETALVERNGGTIELWDLEGEPRLARTLEGIHTGAQARALVAAGSMLHALSVHTHQRADGNWEWSVHHASGTGSLTVRELAVGSAVRAYDLSVDDAGRASALYQNGGIGGPVLLAREGADPDTIPLPAGVEPYPYDDVAPAVVTYADGSAYVLVRRSLPAGPLGQRFEQLVAVRSASGSWELLSIIEDEADPCASVTIDEGASCTVDRTTYGPEAAIVAGPLGPLVLIATHRTRGTRTYSCIDQPGCIPCGWSGELTTENGLSIATDLAGGLAPVGVALHDAVSFMASASGGELDLAVTDHESGACRARYVRIACEQ